jgi:hypothetical protein
MVSLVHWTVFVVSGFLELGIFYSVVFGLAVLDVVSLGSNSIFIRCVLFVFKVFLEGG